MTTCRNVEEDLSLLVDGLLTPAAEDAVRAHVAACDACRQIVDDLTRLTAAARLLGPIDPPARLRATIATAVGAADDNRSVAARGGSAWPWAAVAATLVALTAAAVWLTRTPSYDAPMASSDTAGTVSIADELAQAAGHYERAIAELESLPPGRGPLDPELASVVRANVGVLDRAITESRTALLIDPTNEPARASLFEALQRKVDLLQATALLIEDIPPGDDTTAAGPIITERES